MTDTEIIEQLIRRLTIAVGRHLYGILGSYHALERFTANLQQARTPDGKRFPKPLSVNRGILESIPDDEFRELVEDEPRRPEPVRQHVQQSFEAFIRSKLKTNRLLVLSNLEMVFAYNLELNILRTLAADDNRIILLLPGRRERGNIVMFSGLVDGTYTLPYNFIAENNLWKLEE